MKLESKQMEVESLAACLQTALVPHGTRRLGLLSSIDGRQLVALVLAPDTGTAELWEAPLVGNRYPSLTPLMPQMHWFERGIFDMFGVVADGHPRLKNLHLHEQYPVSLQPLRHEPLLPEQISHTDRKYHFLTVKGEGIYELPVGPIHAGVIEPGHFRFSCFGETIVNLEIQLGFVHRGVEKRMTEVPWRKARFVAEAAAGDTAAANALAHAITVESLLEIEPPAKAQYLRSLALEIERLAMHIIDIGGLAGDIGLVTIAAALSRLRGKALGMGDLLAGSRFLKAFILPGGVRKIEPKSLAAIKLSVVDLRRELEPLLTLFFTQQSVRDRMDGIGKISRSLALEFGLIGVAGRACGIEYDTRNCFTQGVFPALAEPGVVEPNGDVYCRGKVRAREILNSLTMIERLIDGMPEGDLYNEPGKVLPANATSFAVVEAFRGELVHLAFTDENGAFSRYAIKDPSFNNWTAISIVIRNNLIADFPLCNKSLSLSYSGNDL